MPRDRVPDSGLLQHSATEWNQLRNPWLYKVPSIAYPGPLWELQDQELYEFSTIPHWYPENMCNFGSMWDCSSTISALNSAVTAISTKY